MVSSRGDLRRRSSRLTSVRWRSQAFASDSWETPAALRRRRRFSANRSRISSVDIGWSRARRSMKATVADEVTTVYRPPSAVRWHEHIAHLSNHWYGRMAGQYTAMRNCARSLLERRPTSPTALEEAMARDSPLRACLVAPNGGPWLARTPGHGPLRTACRPGESRRRGPALSRRRLFRALLR